MVEEDLDTLAECYFKNREYRRVLHLLRKHSDIMSNDPRLKLLAAQSLMECRDWEECLRFLEDNAAIDDSKPLDADGRKMASVFALLRGKVYEVTENQENALIWYEKAVRYDPYCHEALDRLIGNHLLTMEKEVALLERLQLHEEDEWLRHLYAAKLNASRPGVAPPDVGPNSKGTGVAVGGGQASSNLADVPDSGAAEQKNLVGEG
jgi:tetratricopeptide (TPR) repeat protein